ncbi:hypothetical protein KCU64_g5458, partial [Aureobasidium melanogenum]
LSVLFIPSVRVSSSAPRDQNLQPWLYLAKDIPQCLEDLYYYYYSLYRNDRNKKFARRKIKAKPELEEGAIAASTVSSPALSHASLIDAGTAERELFLPGRNVKGERRMAGAAELRRVTKDQESSLGTRKRGAGTPLLRASNISRTSIVASFPTQEGKANITKNGRRRTKKQKMKTKAMGQEAEDEQGRQQPRQQKKGFSGTLEKYINMRGTKLKAGLRTMMKSTQLINDHFTGTFVKFILTIDGRRVYRMINLADCHDVVALHQTANSRFQRTLFGQVPFEVVLTILNQEFAIAADECGQRLWARSLHTVIVKSATEPCPVFTVVSV